MSPLRFLSCLVILLTGLGAVAARGADEAATRAFLRKEGLGGLHLDQPAHEKNMSF